MQISFTFDLVIIERAVLQVSLSGSHVKEMFAARDEARKGFLKFGISRVSIDFWHILRLL